MPPLVLQYVHPWNVSPAEAIALQQRLRGEVIARDELGEVRRIAGVDVGFEEQGRITRAAVVVLSFPDLTVEEHVLARLPTEFPYVPGLLSFREVPAVLEALGQLPRLPDLLLCDGQGIAHPRRLGIASHLGVLSGLPTIGVAKSRLVGIHVPLAEEKGAAVELYDRGELVGKVLRTRDRVRPLYVSLGHRVSLETSLHYVMRCVTRYRLPEPTRQADKLASAVSRAKKPRDV
ncbi:MAG: deoxyribonuclease V [Pseudomonadota bacterium]